jgi:sulfur-oxidizing protein SoxY
MYDNTHQSAANTRRQALKLLGVAGVAASLASVGLLAPGQLTAATPEAPGMPQPGETVAQTLSRLFGDRTLRAAGVRLKVDLPLIAENGSVVPLSVESNLPMSPNNYVKHVYVITDKNRRPLNAKFTFTPEAGKLSLATNLRMASTSDVRVIAEMSDGTLWEAKQEVKVTVGGCGG